MIIFGGSRSTALAWELGKELRCNVGKTDIKKFPDNEIYVRVESNVRGQECAVIQSTRTSDDFMELFLLLSALKDAGAVQVHAVIPYLGYMRQDKLFKDGEALSAKTVLGIIHELSDSITTINCHFLNQEGEMVFHKINFMNLDAIPVLVQYFKKTLKEPFVVAPDKGSLSYAKQAAEILGCEFNHLEKTRISGDEVEIGEKKLDVKGRDVLILDDIISTGGTILEAAKLVKNWGPSSIRVGCVHGLFINGVEPFQDSVSKLVCTNTLDSPVSKVSVAKLIAVDLKR